MRRRSSSPTAARSRCASCARRKALGIETVLAASAADRDSLAAREADRVVVLGPGAGARVLSRRQPRRARRQGDRLRRLHPGYGFLSERAALARLCEEHGIDVRRPDVAIDRGGRRQAGGASAREGGGRGDDAGQRQAGERRRRPSASPTEIGFPGRHQGVGRRRRPRHGRGARRQRRSPRASSAPPPRPRRRSATARSISSAMSSARVMSRCR